MDVPHVIGWAHDRFVVDVLNRQDALVDWKPDDKLTPTNNLIGRGVGAGDTLVELRRLVDQPVAHRHRQDRESAASSPDELCRRYEVPKRANRPCRAQSSAS